jgi:putative transcriptional regulator
MDQTIHNRLNVLLLLCALLAGIWPGILHAEQPGQMPHVLPSSSFLLVASRQMFDPRFRKSVILVTRHGNSGPIGVIVNHQLEVTLDKIFTDFISARDMHLFYGGPTYSKQISYLVRGTGEVKGALPVSTEVQLAYDLPLLGELLDGKRHYTGLRVMHGLAAWAPGQLENEIEQGSWFVMPFNDALIFDHPPEGMWRALQGHAAVL